MIIKWNENPLKTVIELDEFEEKEFGYKVKISELENRISYAVYLAKLDKSRVDKWDNSRQKQLEYIKSVLETPGGDFVGEYINSLSDIHCGDCTCVPCSCIKCQAEEYLGIDTIKGLRKHEGNSVQSAFENGRNIDQAIKYLQEYDPTNPKPGTTWRDKHPQLWDSAIPSWIKEAISAAEWLQKYKEEHKGEFING